MAAVAAYPLEHSQTVVKGMSENVNPSFIPVNKFPIHPDLLHLLDHTIPPSPETLGAPCPPSHLHSNRPSVNRRFSSNVGTCFLKKKTRPRWSPPACAFEPSSGISSDPPNKHENNRKQHDRTTGRDANRNGKTLIETVILEEMVHDQVDSVKDAQNRGNRNCYRDETPDNHILQIGGPAPIWLPLFHSSTLLLGPSVLGGWPGLGQSNLILLP